MSDCIDTFDSTANPPIESLNPHQILTFIVRWARLKNYWFQGDRDELYALKDRFIQQWVEDGSMFAKTILQRESVAITGMKQSLKNAGYYLKHLNYRGDDWWDTLALAKDFKHWETLVNFIELKQRETQELDDALSWARTVLNNPRLELGAINDSLIDSELEKYIADDALDYLRIEALKIFQNVLDRQLTKASEIYDRLTELPLDYGAIGMNTYSNFQSRQIVHAQFSTWHRINLDLTGYWLIEFESKIDPSIKFQIPYANALAMGFDLDSLPDKDASQDSFEPDITLAEQQQYPIAKLLKILDVTTDYFSQGLRNRLHI
jgi:hypothetical protein